jgi:hypothetical protein
MSNMTHHKVIRFHNLYKFCAESCFHGLVQKLHKFHVIVNMNDIVCIEYLKYSNK